MNPEDYSKAFNSAAELLMPQPSQTSYYQPSSPTQTTLVQSDSNGNAQEEQFVKNEKVLVFHGAMLYEATIMRVNESRPRKPYFLKFTGFGSKYNTWAGSDILIKDLPENRLYQDELKANLQQSMILKNMGKPQAQQQQQQQQPQQPQDKQQSPADSQPIPVTSHDATNGGKTNPTVESTIATTTTTTTTIATTTALTESTITATTSPTTTTLATTSTSTTTAVASTEPRHRDDSEATETDDSDEESLDQIKQKHKKKRDKQKSSSKSPSKQGKRRKKADLPTTTTSASSSPSSSSSSSSPTITSLPGEEGKLYCICRKPEVWPMIGCDACQDWFHLSCVGLTPTDAAQIDKYACPRCAVPAT